MTEAFAGVAMCAAFADGVIESEEDDRFADALSKLPCLASVTDEELQAAFVRADSVARRDGERALLATAARAVPPRLRETAFFLGADIVLADGEVAREEQAFLDELRAALGVDESVARRIVDVVCIRNRA